jgi:DNA-binding NarL/FixJ family response regulator
VSALNKREEQVLRLIAEGKTVEDIAVETKLPLSVTKYVLGKIRRKISASSRPALVQYCVLHVFTPAERAEWERRTLPPDFASALTTLTSWEEKVVAVVGVHPGITNAGIGTRLGISASTVRKILTGVYRKCGLKGQGARTRFAAMYRLHQQAAAQKPASEA